MNASKAWILSKVYTTIWRREGTKCPCSVGLVWPRLRFPSFCLKPLQVKCFEHMLNCHNIIAVLPTGFGKSLLFQLLPHFLPVKVSITWLQSELPHQDYHCVLRLSDPVRGWATLLLCKKGKGLEWSKYSAGTISGTLTLWKVSF